MTPKPKPRNAPAKATKAQPAPQAAPTEPARKISNAVRLISRWRFIEADGLYKAAMASTDAESRKLVTIHSAEQRQIELELVETMPEDFKDVQEMLTLAAEFSMPGGANMLEATTPALIRNAARGLLDILDRETDAAKAKGIAECRRNVIEMFGFDDRLAERKRRVALELAPQ